MAKYKILRYVWQMPERYEPMHYLGLCESGIILDVWYRDGKPVHISRYISGQAVKVELDEVEVTPEAEESL